MIWLGILYWENWGFHPKWKSSFTPALDILGRGGLKACLMTNCMVSTNSMASSWHFSYTSSVCSKHLYLESTLGRQPPCRGRQISLVPAPRASSSSKPQFLFSDCSRLELILLTWRRRESAVDVGVSLSPTAQQKSYTVNNINDQYFDHTEAFDWSLSKCQV